MIRLVALDLDGTLISSTLCVSSRVVATIARAREIGTVFTLVTGRMFAAARPFAQAIGIDGPIVCYQGAAIYVVGTGERLAHTPVARDVTERVFKAAAADGVRAMGYFDDKLYVEADDKYTQEYVALARVKPHIVPSLIEFFETRQSTKLNCVTDLEKADAYVARLKALIGEAGYVTRSQPQFVEVVNPNVDKGRSLEIVARYYNTSADETLAIGDSWNDVPLLAAAGTAVAMGTAPPELLAKADAVVGGVETDGVAEALERFVL